MNMLAAWFHEFDPFIIRFSGDIGIRWYGAAYVAGFFIAYLLLRLLARRKWLAIPEHHVADAMMWLVGGVIVGGRLGYMLVYDPALFTQFSGSAPFWGGFALTKGGMASHGGIVGVIIAAIRVSRGWRQPDGTIVGRCSVWHVFDAAALVCTPGLGLGRLANFINGELLGKIHSPPGTPGPWWTVQFPRELIDRPAPLTADQQAQLADLVQRTSGLDHRRGLIWLVEHAGRFENELRPLLSSRHPSQLYQMLADGPILGGVLWVIWWLGRRGAGGATGAVRRRDGIIGPCFLIGYGVLRVITEVWRLPDAQFGDAGRIYGLSRGQWLSVAMAIVGMVLLIIRLRRTRALSAA